MVSVRLGAANDVTVAFGSELMTTPSSHAGGYSWYFGSKPRFADRGTKFLKIG
jgi:hypothetical protein